MRGLQRKIEVGRRAPGGDPFLSRELDLWATVLRRAVSGAIGIDFAVETASASTLRSDEIAEALPDLALLARLDGPATGLLALGPDLVAAMLEMRTLGRISPRPSGDRRATRTDAALVADVIDAGLAGLDAARPPGEPGLEPGLRFGAHLPDPRQARLLFDDDDDRLRVLSLTLTLPGGTRGGRVVLVLPVAERPAAQVERAAAERTFAADLVEQIGAAPAVLDAVVARITLPLAEVLALAPGDWLRLGTASVDRIDLQGLDGVRRHGARLGQNRGMRAVRLTEADEAAGHGSATRVGAVASPPDLTQNPLKATGT